MRREEKPDGDRMGESSSRNRLVLIFFGGISNSADSATWPGWWYSEFCEFSLRNEGAVPGLWGINDLDDGCRDVCGRSAGSFARMLSLPELSRMCGVAPLRPGGGEDGGEDMAEEGCKASVSTALQL